MDVEVLKASRCLVKAACEEYSRYAMNSSSSTDHVLS